MFLLLTEVLTELILIFLLPTIQEIINWFILLGIRVIISKSDVDDGFGLDFP